MPMHMLTHTRRLTTLRPILSLSHQASLTMPHQLRERPLLSMVRTKRGTSTEVEEVAAVEATVATSTESTIRTKRVSPSSRMRRLTTITILLEDNRTEVDTEVAENTVVATEATVNTEEVTEVTERTVVVSEVAVVKADLGLQRSTEMLVR